MSNPRHPGPSNAKEPGWRVATFTSMKIGYGRIYPTDPNPDSQHEALSESDCQLIVIDDARETGAAQPQLGSVLTDLNAGDTLVVTSLDRLARHAAALVNHVTAIDARKAHLHILDNQIHTGHDPERIFLRTVQSLEDVNTIGRSQRIRSGIKKASSTGRRPGRPPIGNSQIVKIVMDLYNSADEHGNRLYTVTEIAQRARVSRATVYRYIELFNNSGHPFLEN